ncbi:MAG: hypothetical protein QHH17_05720 [Candidatus Bathyarchaeota archaeon]|jgi:uncharacterized ion transporter superfamily protein YfcC|nr:hypothetical protein [Candidatus Bathyarchaeota archaeon]
MADNKTKLRQITFKALKATVKGILFYAAYLLLWMFLAPLSELIPGFHQIIETFVVIYIILMIVGDLTSGTIFKHFFDAAKALFVICYLILSLKGGIFGVTYQNLSLTVDLRPLIAIVTLISLFGFAKSILQAINFLNDKAERLQI